MKNTTPERDETSFGPRLAAFCRRKYPKHTAKRVARDIGCQPGTAKHWLKGNLPQTKHLFRMLRVWPEFLEILLEPIDAAEARRVRLDNELKRLSQVLEHLKEEISNPPKD